MIFVETIVDDMVVYYGGLTFFLAIIVLMHGYRNDILAWPHALLILAFGPLLVLLYIVVVWTTFHRENIWEEKPSAMNKYPITRASARLKIEELKKQQDSITREDDDESGEFDGYRT